MKCKLSLLIGLWLGIWSSITAQQTISGAVSEAGGEALIGVNIYAKSNINQGAVTLTDFDFSFEVSINKLTE